MSKSQESNNVAVIKLLLRARGADIHDIKKIGFNQPAMNAVKLAQRRGFATSIMKMAGRMTRYYARKRVK